ncbi:hypothetical protein M9H77_08511 [Catharanthus roseus]|uniref:Uncharacterized protein n=1 Tax=Catharanthus roseus TaxID=4058 RepID=A0ACC0BYD1_CATRO|nr:hypothetical protein M9H77_08511 [Catharanthus roseus]
MDSEIRSLTDLLHQISTGPISKVREMCRLVKGVLSPVLPEDLGVTLTSPPEVAVTKRWKKTNSTKRDKSHWEHVSITHRKIQKSSGYASSSGSRSGLWSGLGSGPGSRGRGRPPRAPEGRDRRLDRGLSSLSSVVHASLCSTFPYTNTFPAFIYPFISNWKNVIGDGICSYRVVADFVFGDEHQWPEDGPASYEHWLETPDSLYVIANAFNLCVILIAQLGSTTVLLLYSYSDRPRDTFIIDLLIK